MYLTLVMFGFLRGNSTSHAIILTCVAVLICYGTMTV